jgi:hypothetical protein
MNEINFAIDILPLAISNSALSSLDFLTRIIHRLSLISQTSVIKA